MLHLTALKLVSRLGTSLELWKPLECQQTDWSHQIHHNKWAMGCTSFLGWDLLFPMNLGSEISGLLGEIKWLRRIIQGSKSCKSLLNRPQANISVSTEILHRIDDSHASGQALGELHQQMAKSIMISPMEGSGVVSQRWYKHRLYESVCFPRESWNMPNDMPSKLLI